MMDCNYVTFRTLSNFPLDNGFDSYPIGICTHGKQFECIKDTNTSKWTVEYKLSPKGDFQCYQKDMANNLTLVESMMGPHGSTVEDLECAQSNPCDSVWFLDYTWEPKTPDPKPQKKWTVNGLCEKTTVGKAKSQRITCSKKELSIPLIERWNEDRLVIEYFSDTKCQSLIDKKTLKERNYQSSYYLRGKGRWGTPRTGINSDFNICPGEFYEEWWFSNWVYGIFALALFLLFLAVYQCVAWRRKLRRAQEQAQYQGQGQQQIPPVGQQRVAVEGIERVPNAMNGQTYPNYNAYNNPNVQVIYVPRQ